MTNISKEAELNRKYTNHCIRATVITKLDTQGHEARHIMTASGHKKVETIQLYATKTSNEMKCKMPNDLAK